MNESESEYESEEDDDEDEDEEDEDQEEDNDDDDDDDDDNQSWASDSLDGFSLDKVAKKNMMAQRVAKSASSGVKSDQKSTPSTVPQKMCLYIVMEYCPQETLRDAMDRGTLCSDPPRIWKLFRQMLEGLQHLHKKFIIHRCGIRI